MSVTFKVKLAGSDGKEYVQPIDAFIKEHANTTGIRDYSFEQTRERSDEIDYLIRLLKPQFIEALKPQFIEYLKNNFKKSFRSFEVCQSFNNATKVPFNYRNLTWQVWEQLEKEGHIQKKGKSGWYFWVEM